ncbi:hypothetical protein EMCRGX_G021045 [Ephydatia muelleri]
MRILIHVFSISRTMADSEQSTRRPKKERKRPLNKKEDVKRCKLPQWKQGDMRRNSDGGDAASSDSTRRRQEPQWKQADMWRSSDDGDAASSDRQRQEPQWKQADVWCSTGGGDAASSDSTRRRQKPLQSVEQHKRAILLDAIQGATSSHVSSDWARITLLMSINGKLSHILDHISEQAKSVSKKENSAVEFAQESRNEEDWFNGVNLTLIPKRNIYTYGLSLLDIFSKKELRESLLFPSMKSPKPSLCPEKVQRIIATIKRQFPTEPFDLAVFTTKANQKCRDS